MKKMFTSESVTEGHPDKLCDYISDSIFSKVVSESQQASLASVTREHLIRKHGSICVQKVKSRSTYTANT